MDFGEVKDALFATSDLGRISIGSHVLIRSINVPVELATAHGATLRIGDGTFINYGVSIAATSSVDIGARVRIGPYAMIVDTDFHDAYERSARPAGAPVTIGDRAMTGAGSIITGDVPPGALGIARARQQNIEGFTDKAEARAKRAAADDDPGAH